MYMYADIVSRGTWPLLEELKDPDLKGRVLPVDCLLPFSTAEQIVQLRSGRMSWTTQLSNINLYCTYNM